MESHPLEVEQIKLKIMNSLETYKMYIENFEVTFMNGNKKGKMQETVDKYNKVIEEVTQEMKSFCE